MNNAERKRARELCNAATPGPWEVGEFWRDKPEPGGYFPSRWRIFLRGHSNPQTNSRDCDWTKPDASFIAAARTLLPVALDCIDELERERDAARVVAQATQPARQYECVACGSIMQSWQEFPEYQHENCGGLVRLTALIQRDELRRQLTNCERQRDELAAASRAVQHAWRHVHPANTYQKAVRDELDDALQALSAAKRES